VIERLAPAYVVSIDPGLDHTGVATFRLDPKVDWRRADFTKKCAALMNCQLISTKPEWPMSKRLVELAARLRDQLSAYNPELVVVETPAVAGGAYASKRGAGGHAINVAAMGSFFQALGVIVLVAAELSTQELRLVKASTKKKTERQDLLRIALRRVGKEIEATYGSDRLDAIFAGAAEAWNIESRTIYTPAGIA
jgi:Holliday junction resolvasome RuvABC endonuclease subunit